MGKRIQPIVIAGETYLTKKSLTERCQQILHSTPIGHMVDEQWHEFLRELLERHPDAADKVGCGVNSFMVNPSGYGATARCFFVVRADESTEDFSFITCVNGEKPSPFTQFAKACRTAVYQQIVGQRDLVAPFRPDDAISAVCAASGVLITNIADLEMDHWPIPFLHYVRHYEGELIDRGIMLHEGLFVGGSVAGTQYQFVDPALAEGFAELHLKHAVKNGFLRPVHRRAHRRLPKLK